jgi:hypothetical protein
MIAGEQIEDATIVAVFSRSWTEAPLFAVRADRRPTNAQSASGPQSSHPSHDGAVEDLTAFAPQSDGLFVHLTHRNSTP